MATIETIKQEIAAKERRLQKLRLKKATYGYSTDPAIELEIEDIETELDRLQTELRALEAGRPASSPPGQSGSGDYDLRKIRQLLSDIFSEADLRDFCLYEPGFRPVHDDLKETDRKSEILRKMLDHAQRRGLVAHLGAWARQVNPSRYDQGAPYER